MAGVAVIINVSKCSANATRLFQCYNFVNNDKKKTPLHKDKNIFIKPIHGLHDIVSGVMTIDHYLLAFYGDRRTSD